MCVNFKQGNTAQGLECGYAYAVFPSSYTNEEAIEASGFYRYYSHPGGFFMHSLSVRRSKSRVLVIARLDLRNYSVSHATLNNAHLLHAFSYALAFICPDDRYSGIIDEAGALLAKDDEWTPEDYDRASYLINEDLFDALNTFAPAGFYFGAHPGDGSDFGFWQCPEEEEEDFLPVSNGSHALPEGYYHY